MSLRFGSRRWIVPALLALAGGALPLEAAEPQPALDTVLAGFDRVQSSIRTLSASFTETMESPLLKEPAAARGQFYMTKPDFVRWEYTTPEPMRFVIAENEYTGYFPAQKRAEKRDVHRWREQLLRFLGIGQASTELAQFYDITLGRPTGDMADTYLLELLPKKKRVRKRLDAVLLWIDRTSYLPVRVQYTGKSGTRRSITFHDVRVNPPLASSLYVVEIPPGVTVSEGFSALSAFGATER
jgi:outer membrane lipoprotein-sorting protein